MLAPLAASAVTIVDGDIVSPDAAFTETDDGITYYPYDVFIVKIINGKTFKRLILNPQVFDSYGHLEWGNIKTISAATVDGYTTSQLVRQIDTQPVYKLVPDGDTGTKEWLNMTAAEFEAAGYDWDSIYIVNGTDVGNYTTGSDIVDGGTVSSGTLTAVLAADTPASGITVKNAARVPFTKVNLTATGGDVIVDSLVIERTGLAQDGAISSVDIIDDSTNRAINTTSKTFNSLHQANFTDDFTISKGTTKSVILAANMASDLTSYSAEAPSLSLVSVILKGSASVSASLPLTGNSMTNNNTITIGEATISIGAYSNASSTAIQVGKEDYTFFSFQVKAGSAEKIQFSQVRVYQEGSASLGTDVINLELLQDGTKIADGVISTSKYVDFSFSTITIDKGQIAQFQVRADVNDGSARTIKLGIYKTTDLLVKGITYGYNITPTYTGAGFSSSLSPVLHDNEFTISNGTVQVVKSTSVGAENIAVSNNQVLGAFEFEVKGEPVTVSQLVLTVASTGDPGAGSDAILGVELVDPSGSVVAGPTDPVLSTGVVTWSDSFTVPVGKTIYKVRGDLQTSASWASNDTVYVSFTPSAMTITGDVTGNTITATPSSAISGNTQTVKAKSLTVTRNALPATGNVILGSTDVALSSWNFDATDSGEDIRITSILWAGKGQSATNTDALTTFVDENKNGVYDEGTDTALSPVNDALASTDASSTFAFTDPIIITKGTSKHIALKGNKNNTNSNDTEQWGLNDGTASVVAYGISTGNAVVESLTADHGPTLTSVSKGTLVIENASNPASAIVVAGTTGNIFTNVKLTAQYEDLDLDQLVVYVADGSYSFNSLTTGDYRDVTNVGIYNGITKLGEASIPSTGYYTFNFDKGTLTIPKGASNAVTLTIKADMSTVDPSTDRAPGSNSADIKIGFGGDDGVKTTGKLSNSEITGSSYETYRSSTSSAMVLRSSKPIIALPSSTDRLGAASGLTSDDIIVYAFKVTADATGGEVLLYRTTFAFATSGAGVIVGNIRVRDDSSNTLKVSTAPVQVDGVAEVYFTTTFNSPDVTNGDAGEAIRISSGSSKTFYVYADISGADASGDKLTVRLIGDTASTSSAVNVDNSADAFGTPAYDFASQVGNFIWSDNYKEYSISGTDGNNATTQPQWYNGHLVPGLDNLVSTTPYTLSY